MNEPKEMLACLRCREPLRKDKVYDVYDSGYICHGCLITVSGGPLGGARKGDKLLGVMSVTKEGEQFNRAAYAVRNGQARPLPQRFFPGTSWTYNKGEMRTPAQLQRLRWCSNCATITRLAWSKSGRR